MEGGPPCTASPCTSTVSETAGGAAGEGAGTRLAIAVESDSLESCAKGRSRGASAVAIFDFGRGPPTAAPEAKTLDAPAESARTA